MFIRYINVWNLQLLKHTLNNLETFLNHTLNNVDTFQNHTLITFCNLKTCLNHTWNNLEKCLNQILNNPETSLNIMQNNKKNYSKFTEYCGYIYIVFLSLSIFMDEQIVRCLFAFEYIALVLSYIYAFQVHNISRFDDTSENHKNCYPTNWNEFTVLTVQ
jgi:hypothetical protein